jgi:predicted O-methyltransferase YrrM
MTATQWFAQFDKPFLDWIYIDGDHSYTGAYNDFCNALTVVKKGGIIIGDDYKWSSDGDKGGVKKAVNQWAEENDLKLEQYGKNQVVVFL